MTHIMREDYAVFQLHFITKFMFLYFLIQYMLNKPTVAGKLFLVLLCL